MPIKCFFEPRSHMEKWKMKRTTSLRKTFFLLISMCQPGLRGKMHDYISDNDNFEGYYVVFIKSVCLQEFIFNHPIIIWVSIIHWVVVQSPSHVWLFATPWTAACQASLSFAISLLNSLTPMSLLKLMFIVWDVIQPSHLLSPTSPPTLNLSQHRSLFQWAGSSYQVAKVLELQRQSSQWIFRVDFL